jgi:hypothetical protein
MLKKLYLFSLLPFICLANKEINIHNGCGTTVTVGVMTNGGSGTDQQFDLAPGGSRSISEPDQWGGRVWGRYQCSGSSSSSQSCSTPGASNPASLAEFFFNGANGQDYYDISLVDGYNLPMSITPSSEHSADGYNCGAPKCDIGSCPAQYAVKDSAGNVISCKSSCSATGSDKDCCTGSHDDPSVCKPDDHASNVKNQCPDAYSYAYDDSSSTFACASKSYTVEFC